MQIKHVKLGLLGLLASQVAALATPADPNGPLVQIIDGKRQVHPLFTPEFVKELHLLNKRSYRITHRGENAYDYTHPHKLNSNRLNKFSYTSDILSNQTDTWYCHRPFVGTHGTNRLRGIIGFFPHAHGVEVDYPGFVAVRQATDDVPPVIAIVFRGSQSRNFQPLHGILGPSWLTNFSAIKMDYPETLGLNATFHRGFLEKYLAARQSIFGDINDCIRLIPIEQRQDIRFIITGHSQGAGICLPAALDIVHTFGPQIFGEAFNNIETPRFFVYALSGPNSVGSSSTKRLFNDVVGRDNVIRHSSILDIVTYLCLGKHYDRWLYNAILRVTVGIQAGYTPVGHLAIDDLANLLQKGFAFNNQVDNLRNFETISRYCFKGYHEAMLTYQHGAFLSFCYKGIATYHFLRGSHAMGGLVNFIAINHYGSLNASQVNPTECPEEAIDDADNHSYSFDPRLPECSLDNCLERGANHRDLSLGMRTYVDPSQVFTSVPAGFDRITLDEDFNFEALFLSGPNAYESDDEDIEE
ncbi:MAG: hypothetical protein LBD69_00155 [Puniceicoccales bacterium]|jgi:hypothetical protein|nr:hypothetical protein [Puniceicoccales bacterium]